jgi:hypothetical protein
MIVILSIAKNLARRIRSFTTFRMTMNIKTIHFSNCKLYMKIITLHTLINADQLLAHLTQKLNPLFKQQRQQDIGFKIEKVNSAIEISQPELYEGVLFKLEIKGKELWITRNEHYVDDVNSLTVESILNSLFEDMTDDSRGVDLVEEG